MGLGKGKGGENGFNRAQVENKSTEWAVAAQRRRVSPK